MSNDTGITSHALNDQTLVLAPGRALDNSNAHQMVAAITAALDQKYAHVIVDMAEVALLSSAGVGSILGTIESFRSRGGDIVICNLADPIRHVLEVLDLLEYLTIVPGREEATSRCGAT